MQVEEKGEKDSKYYIKLIDDVTNVNLLLKN